MVMISRKLLQSVFLSFCVWGCIGCDAIGQDVKFVQLIGEYTQPFLVKCISTDQVYITDFNQRSAPFDTSACLTIWEVVNSLPSQTPFRCRFSNIPISILDILNKKFLPLNAVFITSSRINLCFFQTVLVFDRTGQFLYHYSIEGTSLFKMDGLWEGIDSSVWMYSNYPHSLFEGNSHKERILVKYFNDHEVATFALDYKTSELTLFGKEGFAGDGPYWVNIPDFFTYRMQVARPSLNPKWSIIIDPTQYFSTSFSADTFQSVDGFTEFVHKTSHITNVRWIDQSQLGVFKELSQDDKHIFMDVWQVNKRGKWKIKYKDIAFCYLDKALDSSLFNQTDISLFNAFSQPNKFVVLPQRAFFLLELDETIFDYINKPYSVYYSYINDQKPDVKRRWYLARQTF